MERLLIFGVLSLTFAFPWQDLLESSDDPLSDLLDDFEDSDNPLNDLLDSFQDAVEEALNQSSTDTNNVIGESQDSNDCLWGQTWCDVLSKCLTVFEDCADDTEDQEDSLVAPGADEDEHGCIGSAGYAWCNNLDACLRSWELDGSWNDLCESISDNTTTSVDSSTENSPDDENFSTSVSDSSSSSDDGYEDHIEDSDNPLSEALDSINEAVEETLNEGSTDTENPLSEALDSANEALQEALNQSSTALDSVKEAVEELIDEENGDLGNVVDPDLIGQEPGDLIDEVLDQSGIDDDNLIGNAMDSYGCLLSAGYMWCDVLSKCLNWEEDCVEDTEDWDDMLLGGDRDENGCIGSAGYLWCEKFEDCLRPWELLGDWDELCEIIYDDASISEDETQLDENVIPTSADDSSYTSDDGNYETKDDCDKGNRRCKGCSKKFFQTRIFMAIVILTCLIASCLCWWLRRRHIRAKRAAKINILAGNDHSQTKGGERVGETTARKEGESSGTDTTAPDYNAYSNVV